MKKKLFYKKINLIKSLIFFVTLILVFILGIAVKNFFSVLQTEINTSISEVKTYGVLYGFHSNAVHSRISDVRKQLSLLDPGKILINCRGEIWKYIYWYHYTGKDYVSALQTAVQALAYAEHHKDTPSGFVQRFYWSILVAMASEKCGNCRDSDRFMKYAEKFFGQRISYDEILTKYFGGNYDSYVGRWGEVGSYRYSMTKCSILEERGQWEKARKYYFDYLEKSWRMINEFGYGSEEITIEIYARIARNYRICKDKKNANIFADKGVAISDQLLKEGQWVGEAFLEKFELLVSEEKNMEACKFIQKKLDKQTFVEKYRELSSKILVCKKLIKLYRNMNKKEEEKQCVAIMAACKDKLQSRQ